jgi:hypothetical protein
VSGLVALVTVSGWPPLSVTLDLLQLRRFLQFVAAGCFYFVFRRAFPLFLQVSSSLRFCSVLSCPMSLALLLAVFSDGGGDHGESAKVSAHPKPSEMACICCVCAVCCPVFCFLSRAYPV